MGFTVTANEIEVSQRKLLRMFDMIAALHSGPKTARTLLMTVPGDVRTIYRYIRFIQAVGGEIEQDTKGRYHLKKCPICKSQNH